MNFLILVLLLCLPVFLYIVFILSKDDFVILRSNTAMEKIFNVAILSGLSGLFFSRLIFVVANPNPVFHSLLGFLLFPYFPGLSLIGGLIGGFGFSLIFLKSKAMPALRLMDFFSTAFIVVFPIGLIGTIILSDKSLSIFSLGAIILSFIYLFFFAKFVLPKTLGSKLKDGTLSILFLCSFSVVYILIRVLLSNISFTFDLENILSVGLFISCFVFLVKKEKLLEMSFEKWKHQG